jgi:hypothetical protein
MRIHLLHSWLVTLTFATAAQGQAQLPTAPGDGAPGNQPTVLAQFQPGLNPAGRAFGLLPGQMTKLALYCADLFADGPNDHVWFNIPPSDAMVTLASGQSVGLSQAVDAGLLAVRGRGAQDPGPPPPGQYYEVVMANTGAPALEVSVPAGTLFVPKGQVAPEITPGIRRLFAAARQHGLLGSDILADAVWATRGFTRADVEQTGVVPLTDRAAAKVQALLSEAGLSFEFGRGTADYARLYEQRSEDLARSGATAHGTAQLSNGRATQITVLSDGTREALVQLTDSKGGMPLYYAGHVLTRLPGQLQIELLHLKTGRPLQAARGPLTVKLATLEGSDAGTAIAR